MERTESRSRRSSGPRPSPPLGVAPLALLWLLPSAQTPEQPRQIIIDSSAQRLAIPDCIPRRGDEASREACRTITQVLRDDLKFEGLFQFVTDNLYSAIPPVNADAVNFDDWAGIGANILVVTRAEVTGGEMSVEAKVYSVGSKQTMLAKRYSGRPDNPRLFSHQASDDIMTLTNYKGVARTKIAFTSDRDTARGKKVSKELYIADYDGYNPRRVTVNGSLNLLPAWNPDGRSVAYVSYRQGTPQVYVASIFEGRSTPNLTGERGSQAFAPAYSHDGKRIAFASNRSGNMEVWVANADGSGARNLTKSQATDTAPCWSPTGQEIAFTSNRGGTPQVYLMDSEGLNVRRLTTVGNYNDAPAWNPAKLYTEIAYTSRLEGGAFQIAIVDVAGGQVRQITEGRGSCEYPSWAPSGRHLVFSCQRAGTWQLMLSDREGRNVRALQTGAGNNVYPDWGP